MGKKKSLNIFSPYLYVVVHLVVYRMIDIACLSCANNL